MRFEALQKAKWVTKAARTILVQEVLAIRGFWGKWKSANYKTANFKVPHIWVSMSPNIVLFPFYNANWQSFINFI